MATTAHMDGQGTSAEGKGISFFRSAPMTLIQLYIPMEAAQTVVSEIGSLGVVQFRDLNAQVTAFQRPYTGEIRKLEEMERKVRVLLEHAQQEDVAVRSWLTASPQANAEGSGVRMSKAMMQELDELETVLEETETRVRQLDASQRELFDRFVQMLEWYAVITALSPTLAAGSLYGATGATGAGHSPAVLDGGKAEETDSGSEAQRMEDRATETLELGGGLPETRFVAGALPRRKLAAFERVLWKALRGNVYIRSADFVLDTRGLSTPLTKEGGHPSLEPRTAFVAFVHGSESRARVKRICEALGCALYEIDNEEGRREAMAADLMAKLDDLHAVLFNTRQAKRAALGSIGGVLERWLLLIRRQKAVLDTMNRFGGDSNAAARKHLLAEGWCPTYALPSLDAAIRTASDRAGLNVAPVITVLASPGRQSSSQASSTGSSSDPDQDHDQIASNSNAAPAATAGNAGGSKPASACMSRSPPPTFFPTTRLTLAFQEMTDAYGIARYGEANPSLFMIISFPFLFAIMFGDLGHALIMTLFSLWMVLCERRLARHSGEIFEMIFGGRYVLLLMGVFSIFTGLIYNDLFSRPMAIFPSAYTFIGGKGMHTSPSAVYPFGIDPAWRVATNAMAFINSYKMKQAVLLGIVQMLFGILINASNHLHFGSQLDLYCTFLPQLIFMLALFGYLAFLIVYKWIAAWDVSILNMFISMVLRFGALEGPPVYSGQQFVQTVLMVIALLCVPWMLLAKPILILLEKRRLSRAGGYHAPRRSDSIASHNGEVAGGGGVEAKTNKGDHPDGGNCNASEAESISSTARKAAADKAEHGMGELAVHQLIHTIEFVLGSVSNTASYLRLWALSLAHAELSDVLWEMTIASTVTNPFTLIIGFAMWFIFTVLILVAMEGMSAFLHALRLHWVEFNNKFYTGDGVKFEPFCLRDDLLLKGAGR